MKKTRIILALILVFAIAMTGCGKKEENEGGNLNNTGFNYSQGIDANGFWEGVKASDLTELPDYMGLEIPASEVTATEENIDSAVNSILESYLENVDVYDRPAENFDTVSIGYIGRMDGKEFAGGTGTKDDLVLGTGTFIDGFEDGIIGHTPGETFMLDLKFPEEYGNKDLNGKDVQFEVTLNSIKESVLPELTDDFVADTLSESYNGVKTVEELKAEVAENLKTANVMNYISDYLGTVTVIDIPESMIEYQKGSMKAYYEEYAAMYGIELSELLTAMGMNSDIEAVIEEYKDQLTNNAKYYLVLQAIAEKENISVSDEDVKNYFLDNTGEEDYSRYEEYFGMGYVKCMILGNKVLEAISDNAVIAE